MRNEDTLLLHSTYGEGRDDGDGGSVFLLLRNGGERRGRFGSFAAVLPSPEKGRKGQSDWRCEEGARWRTPE